MNYKISMRKRVLLTILPIAIIPIILVAGFSAFRLFGKLKEQGNVFYSTILTQLTTNIDFVYSQHAMAFVDIARMDNFSKIINAPQPIETSSKNFDKIKMPYIKGKKLSENLDKFPLEKQEKIFKNSF